MAPLYRWDGSSWKRLGDGSSGSAPSGNKKVAVLGDSKAYQGGTGEDAIKQALNNVGISNADVYVSGVTSRAAWGGAVTPTVQTSWDDMISSGFNPDIVITILGGNIRTSQQSTWEFQFNALLDYISNGSRQIFCMNLAYADSSDGAPFNAWFEPYIATKGAQLIDQYAMMRDREANGRTIAWYTDNVHMQSGDNGYGLINTLLAERVAYFLDDTIRPAGPEWVRYEDIAASGTDLQQVVNRVTANRKLSLPAGTFIIPPNFANGYMDGIRIAHQDWGAGCRGIGGAGGLNKPVQNGIGSGSQKAVGARTILRIESSNRSVINSNGVNTCYSINASPVGENTSVFVEFRNFQLDSTVAHDHGGLRISGPKFKIENVLITGTKGSDKMPPGETGGISIWKSTGGQAITRTDYLNGTADSKASGVVRNTEVDGRRGATRVSSSTVMPNSSRGLIFENCYFHHTLTGGGGIAWYYTDDSLCVNTRSEYIGSGPGQLQGYSFNHEQSTRITYINPVMICDRNTVGGTLHMSLNSVGTAGVVPDCVLTVYNPTWDATAIGGGQLCIETWTVSGQQQRRRPDVYDANGNPLAFTYINSYI